MAVSESSSSLEVDLVTSTSMRLRWQAPSTPFQIDGARIAVRHNGTKPLTIETRIMEDSYVAVNLIPDSEYEFHVIFLHEKNRRLLIIDGTKLVSQPVRTAKAGYVKAWFFENIEEIERQWAVYYSNTQVEVEEEPAISQVKDKCFTGRRCMALNKPVGLRGGCCVDAAPLKRCKKYLAEVYVMSENECAGGVVLKAWDYEAGHWSSSQASTSDSGWQKLEVNLIGGPLERVKLSIECSEDYRGTLFVDACSVTLVGRDKVGEAAHLLERDAEFLRSNKDGVVTVALVEAVNLPRFPFSKPPFLPDMATLDDDEGTDEQCWKSSMRDSDSHRRRRRRPNFRFVARWRGKLVAEAAVVAGNQDDNDLTDAARPSWVNVNDASQLSCTLDLRNSLGGDSASTLPSLLGETFEVELQDMAVTGRAAKLKRQKLFAATSTHLSSPPSKEDGLLESASVGMLVCTKDISETLALRENSLFGGDSAQCINVAGSPLPALLPPPENLPRRARLDSLKSASSKRLMLLTGLGASENSQVAPLNVGDENESLSKSEGAPVARLQLSIRELLAAPAYRGWYRLEDEDGLTQACVALVLRSWDPDGSGVDDLDEDSAIISRLASSLARSNCNSRIRADLFRELLRLLGVSSKARARHAGNSSRGKNDRFEVEEVSESTDPTEAQARLDPILLLERKRRMLREGLLEECIANLHDPVCVEASAALLVALVTFPAKLIKTSPDIARCRATLQRMARRNGVLAFVEEASDVFSKSLQGEGASNARTAAVAPLTEKQLALAAAVSAAGAPSAPPSVSTASAVLAAVCSSRRVLQEVLESRPGMFAILAQGASEGIAGACSSLEMLNFAASFSSALLNEYRAHRVLVPADVPGFWRCPSLEAELSDDKEDIRQLCREGRRRERASERHRQATGTFPRRVRVRARLFARVRSLSGEAFEFARLSLAGGPAFRTNDANRDDQDLVAVAFDRLASTTLHVRTAENEPNTQPGTPDTPGTPPLRPPTAERRRQMAIERQHAVEIDLRLAEENRPRSRDGKTDDENNAIIDNTNRRARDSFHTIDEDSQGTQVYLNDGMDEGNNALAKIADP